MLDRTRLFLHSAVSLLCLAAPLAAQFKPTVNINCAHYDALAALAANSFPNTVINIRGTCTGPIAISASGLQLNAVGAAAINGNGKDAVTITGAQRVTLSGLAVTGGNNGIVAQNGAQVTLANVTVSGNKLSGIVALANSSITATGGSSQGNGVHGLDIEATSALVVTGSYAVSGNGVFGININNGSSITLTGASLTVTQNTLGIQLGTNASGFLDGQSTLNASQNLTDGITIVSGSHVVDFGGTIQANGNGIHGISLNAKAGLDLDAGSQVTSSNNPGDGVHLEQESELSVFNIPQFSGNPNTTLLTVTGNGNGIEALSMSRVLVDNTAAIVSQTNTFAGVRADDGSSVSLSGSTLTGNDRDLQGTFGSRLTSVSTTIGTLICDATVLIRGDTGRTCPH
jgi:hypothetical protein